MDAQEFQKAQKAKLLACYGETPESVIEKAQVSEVEEDSLEKGGEGSRGGKIIGHTKSGKPIYGEGPLHNVSGEPSDWNAKSYASEDHKDAAEAHKTHTSKLRELYSKKTKEQSEARKSNDLKAHKAATKEKQTILQHQRRSEDSTGQHEDYAANGVPKWMND